MDTFMYGPVPSLLSSVRRIGTLFGLLTGCLAIAANANAQLIASDSFNDAAGVITGDSGGTGWSGSWNGANSVTSPGLQYNGLTSSGNEFTTIGSGQGSYRYFASPPSTVGSQIWIAFLTSLTPGSTTAAYAGLSLVTASNQEILFLGATDQSGFYGMVTYSSAGATGGNTTIADTSTTHLVVGLLDGTGSGNTVNAYLWIDPSLSSTPSLGSANYSIANSGLTDLSFGGIRLQSGTSNTNQVMSQNFDEIRIGSDYHSVIQGSASAPEPSSLALLTALGLLAVAGMVRRRRTRLG